MKKLMKNCIVIVLLLTIVLSIGYVVNAADGSDIIGRIDKVDKKTDQSKAKESSENIVGSLLDIMRSVAVGVALIMLVVLAVKYMSAAPGDKAEIKKHAVVYIVGAVILFGAAGIITIIGNFAKSNIAYSK